MDITGAYSRKPPSILLIIVLLCNIKKFSVYAQSPFNTNEYVWAYAYFIFD